MKGDFCTYLYSVLIWNLPFFAHVSQSVVNVQRENDEGYKIVNAQFIGYTVCGYISFLKPDWARGLAFNREGLLHFDMVKERLKSRPHRARQPF